MDRVLYQRLRFHKTVIFCTVTVTNDDSFAEKILKVYKTLMSGSFPGFSLKTCRIWKIEK